MGSLFSYCHRRRRPRYTTFPGEYDPLLPKRDFSSRYRTERSKVVQAFAAFKAGKLPSQDQLQYYSRRILRSAPLDPNQAHVSSEGEGVILAVREFLSSFLVFGLEKNSDDIAQELIYELRRIDVDSINVDLGNGKDIAPAIKNTSSDLALTIQLFSYLTRLWLRSSAFRILFFTIASFLHNTLATFASTIGDRAQRVEATAGVFENIADGMEKAAADIGDQIAAEISTDTPMNTEVLKEKVTDVLGEVKEDVTTAPATGPSSRSQAKHWENTAAVDPLDLTEAEIKRVLLMIHQDEKSILLLRKFINMIAKHLWQKPQVQSPEDTISSFLPSTFPTMATHTRIFLERLASGRSLDPLLSSIAIVESIRDSEGDNPLHNVAVHTIDFLSQAVEDAQYVESQRGADDLHALLLECKHIFELCRDSQNTTVASLRQVLQEAKGFIDAMKADKTTRRIFDSIISLNRVVTQYSSSVVDSSISRLSSYQWNDLRSWFIPTLLGHLIPVLWPVNEYGTLVPIPRVEFKNADVDAVVDGRSMRVLRYSQPSTSNRSWWARFSDFLCCADESDSESDVDAEGSRFSVTEWLTPSRLRVQRQSDTIIDMNTSSVDTPANPADRNGLSPSSLPSRLQTHDSIHLSISDLFSTTSLTDIQTIEFSDVWYHVHYKKFTGYFDEGSLGLGVDFNPGASGINLDIEFQLETETEPQTPYSPSRTSSTPNALNSASSTLLPILSLRVGHVHLTIPDTLTIIPYFITSRHRLINRGLLEPIVFPLLKVFLRRKFQSVAQQSVQQILVTLVDLYNRTTSSVREKRIEHQVQGSLLSDWWYAFMDTLSPAAPPSDEAPPASTTQVTATTAGIEIDIFDSNDSPEITQSPIDDTHDNEDHEPATTITVGVAPNVVSSQPENMTLNGIKDAVLEGAKHSADDAINEAARAVQDTVVLGEVAVDEVRAHRVSFQEVERQERQTGGWRSDAFDL